MRIIILGPTASGKTELSLQLAKELGTSIISADSRQCFSMIDIGTAKPSAEELERIQHYNISNLSLDAEDSAIQFHRRAISWEKEILKHSDHVIYVGDWGRIEKSAIKRALEHSPELSDKVTGCVVNRVNINKFAKYGEGALIGYPANKAKSKNIPARLRKKLTMLHMLVDKLTRSFIRERRTNLR